MEEDLLRQMRGQRLNTTLPLGYSGNGVSAASVVALAIHPLRRNSFLRSSRKSDRSAHGYTRRSPSLRD